MPRDVTVTFADGSTHVYAGAPDDVTPEAVQERAQQEFGKPVVHLDGGRKGGVAGEVGKVLDKGVRGGLTALPGLILDAGAKGVGGLVDAAKSVLPDSVVPEVFKAPDTSKFGDMTAGLQTAGGVLPPVSEPDTKTGRRIANVLEAIVGTVAGGGTGSIASKAAIGAGSGVGGEAAAQVTGDNPVARFIGSLLGGGVTAIGQAHVPNADKLIKENTAGMTDKDWLTAKNVEKVLNALGMSHLKSQLLGPRSTLDDVVATASANPTVRPKIVTATADVPGQAKQALEDWGAKNLPASGAANRAEVLQDVQGTAQSAIDKMRDVSNRAFVGAMPPKSIEYDQGRVRTLYNSLRQLSDDPRFGATTDAGKSIQRFADRLVEGREWDTSGVNPTIMLRAQQEAKAKGIPLDPSQIPGAKEVTTFVTNAHKINNLNKEAKLLSQSDDFKGLPLGDIRRIMNQATPEFDRARAAKSAIMDSTVNPAKQGLTGQIAQMGGGVKADKQTATDRAINLVFNPTSPQSLAIHQMAKEMGPEAVGELLREHVNKTMQLVLKGSDKSPHSFKSALFENDAQKENINAALEVIAAHQGRNPADVKAGFQKLMDAMDSYKDMKIAIGVSPAAVSEQAGQNVVGSAAQPLSTTRRTAGRIVTAATYGKIADLVTSKDGLAKLEAISKAPKSETLRQLLAGVLTSTNEAPAKGD